MALLIRRHALDATVLATTLVALFSASNASAQASMVRVTHYPAPGKYDVDQMAFHWKPGARFADSTIGLPSSVVFEQVPAGEQVCYVVHGANPLLYSYGMTATDVPVAPSADLDAIVKQIAGLFGPEKTGLDAKLMIVQPEVATKKGPDPADYRALVRSLAVDQLDSAAKIKRASDGALSFATTYADDSTLWESTEATNAAADKIYKQLEAANPEAPVMPEFRALQEFAYAQLIVAHKAVKTAADAMRPGREALAVCKPMPTGRTRFGLTITAKPADATVKPGRKVSAEKETLAQFTLDPEYVERFRIAPGVFVAGLFGQDRDVGVVSGKLTIAPTGRTYSRTGMFAMARGTDYLWPTIGVAKADGSSSVDLFAGVQLRAGNFIFGPEVSVGLGLAWMEVPVGAGSLQPGDPLPDNKKLADVVSRERHFGLGLTFTISGLDLGKGDSAGKGDKATPQK
jgi:hypothetical protein